MYDEEMFWESQVDEEMAQLTDQMFDTIRKRVRNDITEELERLRAENNELRPIKDKLNELEYNFKKKERELEREYVNKTEEYKKSTLQEIINEHGIEYWDVAKRPRKIPKCDKCNENRSLVFFSPTNKEYHERCSCDKTVFRYEVVPVTLYEIIKYTDKWSKQKNRWRMLYRFQKDKWRDSESLIYDACNSWDEPDSKNTTDYFMKRESDFDNYKYNHSLFETKELAQKYCDIQNEKEEEKEKEEIEKSKSELLPRSAGV